MHFQHVQLAPPDPILGISESFRADSRDGKVNLAVGVYKDGNGKTPMLAAVAEAQRQLVAQELPGGYLPITGLPALTELLPELLFGAGASSLADRLVVAQAPGGTGALRVSAEFLASVNPTATVWISSPTWPNHVSIFSAAGLTIGHYPWLDAETNGLDFNGVVDTINKASAGDILVLHGCCHNPTGVDPSTEQWHVLARLCVERKLIPVIDFAYQGFGNGLEEDAVGLRIMAEAVPELLVCSSFSKNFGMYGERVGAMTLVCGEASHAAACRSQIQGLIRRNYSNPPTWGARLVAQVLNTPDLRAQWIEELGAMRVRIQDIRAALTSALDHHGVNLHANGNDFISKQLGMFTMTGLTKEQVLRLQKEFAVYAVASGRVNVAGMTEDDVGPVSDAIARVVLG